MSDKTNGADETCGRCGYPKSDHAQVVVGKTHEQGATILFDGTDEALICPTALFLKDELQTLMAEKAS